MDRRHGKKKRRAHRQAKRASHHNEVSHHPRTPMPPDPLDMLTEGLYYPHPLTFVSHVSSLWAALDRATDLPGLPDDEQNPPERIEFLQSMLDIYAHQTTAVLTVLRQFVTDELMARRISRELSERTHLITGWLADLDQVQVVRVARQTEPLGDGDQYWIELQWPDGSTLSIGILVDANWGNAFKDVLVIPDQIGAAEAIVAEHAEPEEMITFETIPPADVRARVSEAVRHTDMFHPPLETESWPQARPLLEWILRLLPDGGEGFPLVDLDENDRGRIVDRFLTSPDAEGLGGYVAETVDTLIWFAGFNCGDPLRWSPIKVEQLLGDWWHRKVVQSAEVDRVLPQILRAFVRWCGRQKGLPSHLVDETLTAIDRVEPHFLDTIGTPRRNTAVDLARKVAGFDVDDEDPWADDEDDDPWRFDADADEQDLALMMTQHLADSVGGIDVLESLYTEPLPDEVFDETGIADDILPLARRVVKQVENDIDQRGFEEGIELRTSVRRIVRRLALTDPAAWRRKAAPASTACAVAYLVYGENDILKRTLTVKDLVADFGLRSAPQSRVSTFAKALFPEGSGQADLLTGTTRARIIELRELFRPS